MDSKEIINGIKDFFRNADEKALSEVNAAFDTEFEGDILLEEYLQEFGNGYPYCENDMANHYESNILQLDYDIRDYDDVCFEGTKSDYSKSNLYLSTNIGIEHDGRLTNMIKTAA